MNLCGVEILNAEKYLVISMLLLPKSFTMQLSWPKYRKPGQTRLSPFQIFTGFATN